MDDQIVEMIEEYCRVARIKPATLCVRATGNSRLYTRTLRSLRMAEDVRAKLVEYIAQNPPLKDVGPEHAEFKPETPEKANRHWE